MICHAKHRYYSKIAVRAVECTCRCRGAPSLVEGDGADAEVAQLVVALLVQPEKGGLVQRPPRLPDLLLGAAEDGDLGVLPLVL